MKIDYEYQERLLKAFENAPQSTVDIEELQADGFYYREEKFIFHIEQLIRQDLIERADGKLGCGLSRGADGEIAWSVIPLRLTPLSETRKGNPMVDFFKHFPSSPMDIVSPEGEIRCSTNGIFASKGVQVDDTSIEIQVGDEIRRKLSIGKEEVFQVVDVDFNEKFHAIPAHYNIKTSKKGTFKEKTGGYYINASGNARVNIGGVDNSTNNYGLDSRIFEEIRTAVEKGIADQHDKAKVLAALNSMQSAKDSGSFMAGYRQFITDAASYMTIVAPFLPALMPFLK